MWGYNDSGEDHRENSFTVESNLQLGRFAAYGRFENIEKSASELLLEDFDCDRQIRPVKILLMLYIIRTISDFDYNLTEAEVSDCQKKMQSFKLPAGRIRIFRIFTFDNGRTD